jgi:hypothetical protein
MDRGHHDPVATVVDQGQRPRQMATHVAERVVPHDGKMAQGVARLVPQRGHLLAQTLDVFGEIVAGRPAAAALASKRHERQQQSQHGAQQGQRGERVRHDA